MWDRPGMVASFVAGISPLLQGRNGYLLSIIRKDRFLVVNAKNKQKQNKEQPKKEEMETPLQTWLGFSSNNLQEHVMNLQTNNGNLQAKMY